MFHKKDGVSYNFYFLRINAVFSFSDINNFLCNYTCTTTIVNNLSLFLRVLFDRECVKSLNTYLETLLESKIIHSLLTKHKPPLPPYLISCPQPVLDSGTLLEATNFFLASLLASRHSTGLDSA